MTIAAQRNWLAACVALAVVACSGNASQFGRNAGAAGALSASAGDGSAGALDTSAAGAAGSTEGNDEAGAGGAAGAGEAPQLRAGSPSGGSAAAGAGTAGAGTAGAGTAGAGTPGAGTAGVGSAPSPVIASGTHLCYGADDCVGPVECRGKASSSIQVCLKSCESDDDCSANHRCVLPGGPLRPDAAGCFLRCEDSPLICPYAFDCYDLSGEHDYTCLPRQW